MKHISLPTAPAILFLSLCLLLLPGHLRAQKEKRPPRPKNIILFIGDGMGFNHVKAANCFQGVAAQCYESFPVKLAQCHYPAKAGGYSEDGSGTNNWATGYNTVAAWNDTAWLKRNVTESAASGTALGTGVKTYNNSVGIGIRGDTLENLTQRAKAMGKSAGVVTSVPFSHATPAGQVAHNATRVRYSEIAAEMLLNSRCDVIMGCGNPMFDNNGKALKGGWKSPKYVGDSALWSQLLAGSGKSTSFTFQGVSKRVRDVNGDGLPDPWTVVTSRSEFRKLASGNTPKRVLGVPQVYSTLQQSRDLLQGETKASDPFVTPFNPGVPTLAEMTMGAINVLDNNPAGFFLMVEGGAVDWAAHDNQKGRMIEEMMGFNEAVAAVVDWVERHGGWEENLVVVTADHETGLLWGDAPFAALPDRGKGLLPAMEYYSGEHSQSLVPFYAKGCGSDIFRLLAEEQDQVRGAYLHNSEVAIAVKLLWPVAGRP